MKKAQAAMEFLMTYGWAILVVLAAIGALAYFGVLSPDRFMPSKCVISGGFSCAEYKLSETDSEVRVYIQNNVGDRANVTAITVTNANNEVCTVDFDTNDPTTNGWFILNNGQKSDNIIITDCLGSMTSFKGSIVITYMKADEVESHTASGSVSGRFED